MSDRMPLEPVKLQLADFIKGESFEKDVEKKFKSGIQFGDHGFDITRAVKFNTEDTTVARYQKGPLSRNISGQYILLEIPDAAITSKFEVKHDLKRNPNGILLVHQSGVDKASGLPFILKDTLYGLISYPDNGQNWNKERITLSAVRLYSSGYPQRMVIIII